jgi:hypothetical protein
MAARRFSRLQKRLLAWLAMDEQADAWDDRE